MQPHERKLMVALNGARTVVLGLSFAMMVTGCKRTPATDDASLNTQVQARLFADQNLNGQSIQTSVANGIVTLNGTVTSDSARTIASGDVAQVAGVKTVVDNLVVRPPPPPPAPVRHDITLPAGTSIPVRITQTLDSKTTQSGDRFTGAIASDIIVDGMVVLPQGTPVTGHVDAAQDAAHFKGNSLLTISLSSISHKGERIDCATEPYTKQGEGRGKNTAEKVGGGAAVGAILGGILGGGKGAAIGAAAGGGVGAGANTVTRGQQVQIPSETVVRFKLSDAIIVHITTGGGSQGNSGPALEHHNDQ